ncbi:MAG: VWA domain-containing protein [Proteobacteria bacterium]|nr:VWA domain-containing protein [Pseudomonadota bacterium]
MIEAILQDFHFLRPQWFYAIIPALLLFALLKYRQSNASNWDKAIDPELLTHLLETPSGTVGKSPYSLILIAWLIATLALAGPVWEKKAQQIYERENALIVIFDLTRSMYAADVKPNRLVRARRKLIDLLGMREEGITGLVVFAGDAHTVTPLTDDTNTIIAMIPALTPQIMPARGSKLAPAISRAIELFHNAGVASGRILIITDEIRDMAEAQAIARNYRYSFPVSVLSVGTADGAPIPLAASPGNAGYLKDRAGNLIIPKVDSLALQDFANLAGGRFSTMTLADEDLAYLLADDPLLEDDTFRVLERDFDVWFEQGPWLLLLLLPLASLAFRRGWIWGLALLLILPAEPAMAGLWDDLWQTRDQQAMTALDKGEANEAARLFENTGWKGSAFYKGENFADAGNQFATIDNSDARYNLGNSLAKQSRYEEAIEAYTQSLALQPDHEDAVFNKQLIEELLSQQQQQQQQQQDKDGEQSESPDQEQGEQQSQNEQNDAENESQDGNEQDEQQQDKKEEPSQEPSDEQDAEPQNQRMAEEDAKLDAEEQQALQQWLRRVPDDPGGLLRRKFGQQYEDRIRQGKISRNNTDADW